MQLDLNDLKQQLKTTNAPIEQLAILQEMGWLYALRESARDLQACLTQADAFLDADIPQHYHVYQMLLRVFHQSLSTSYLSALEDALSLEKNDAKHLRGTWRWRVHFLLGSIYSRSMLADDAIKHYRRIIEISRHQGDHTGEAIGLNAVGLVYGFLKDYDQAKSYFEQSLTIARQHDDIKQQFTVYHNLAQMHIATGEIDGADEAVQKTLRIAYVLKDLRMITFAIGKQALVLIGREQYATARQVLEQQLTRISDDDTLYYPRITLGRTLARIYGIQGEHSASVDLLEPIIEQAEIRGHKLVLIESLQDMVNAHEALGNYREALTYHKQYHALYQAFHDDRDMERLQMREILYRTRETEMQLRHQRQIAQDAVKRAEQTHQYFEELNNIKKDFIDSATHDLKNPLTGIHLNAQLLRRKIDSQFHRHLDHIESDTARMNRLISDMLDVAKLETGDALNLQLHSLSALLDKLYQAHSKVADTRAIRIDVDAPPQLHSIFDEHYLYRCLSNLLSNAIKYSENGGQVKIKVDVSQDHIQITIHDNGIGIPPADLPHIFERFYRVEHESTRQIEGTGLGLSIVKSIVEQHGGTIVVESVLAQGSTFTINLPNHTQQEHLSDAS
ncbi:MAG: ATP-binding protein [Anaerolineae bacterium]